MWAASASGSGELRHGGVSSPTGRRRRRDEEMRPDAGALVLVDHRQQEFRRRASRVGGKSAQNAHEAGRLQAGQLPRQRRALGACVEKPLAPVVRALARLDETAVEQLLEDAVEALLGDLENVEQRRDGEAWTPVDEMQHPVVRAAEFIFLQQTVRVLHEVSIGEKKQLHHVENRVVALRREIPRRRIAAGAQGLGGGGIHGRRLVHAGSRSISVRAIEARSSSKIALKRRPCRDDQWARGLRQLY